MNTPGSSPRVWGQVVFVATLVAVQRIIPTRVGTSSADEKRGLTGEDHPHACGDKPCVRIKTAKSSGSSPRVWGQGVTEI